MRTRERTEKDKRENETETECGGQSAALLWAFSLIE